MDREERNALEEISGFDALSFGDRLFTGCKKDTIVVNLLNKLKKKERKVRNRWSYDHIKKQKVKLA